jgi:hypothetical protein
MKPSLGEGRTLSLSVWTLIVVECGGKIAVAHV